MILLLACLTLFADSEREAFYSLAPDFLVTEDGPEKDGQTIGYPYDALIHEGKLYVADYYANVMVFSPDRLLAVFGRVGQGPKEFRRPPVALRIKEGLVTATEMYGRRQSLFALNGAFVRREDLTRGIQYLTSDRFKELKFQEATAANHRYQHLESGAYFSGTHPNDSLDYHLAQALFLADAQCIYQVKRCGVIDIFERGAPSSRTIQLPLELLKKDIEADELGTQLNRRVVKGNHDAVAYRFGVPIVDAALQADGYIWLLAADEHYENHLRRPELVYLYRVNLEKGVPDFVIQLREPASRLRISEGHLVLISTEFATIRAYALDRLKPILN